LTYRVLACVGGRFRQIRSALSLWLLPCRKTGCNLRCQRRTSQKTRAIGNLGRPGVEKSFVVMYNRVRTANRHRWMGRESQGARGNVRSGTRQKSGRTFGIRPTNQCFALEIPNDKIQISNKFQIPIFKLLNFGHWSLFEVWRLKFGASTAKQWLGRSERPLPTVYQKHRSLQSRKATYRG